MTTTTADRDERLAALLTELDDRVRRGEAPDVSALAAAHPDVAEELLQLWGIAQYAGMARKAKVAEEFPATVSDSSVQIVLPRPFGEFILLTELGRGGMGVVYKAKQRSLGRILAVKMVREAHLASPADRARFQAEAEAAGRLHHPNIVTVYESGTADGQAYFGMEFVDGCTLAERLVRDGPFPPREAARLLAAVARAVQHAHENGILHRDLKPSNVLLTSDDAGLLLPKVTDFGLSKRFDRTESLTRTGAIVGTPSYMSPEQATGKRDLTPAADVYSLGAILYEMLTGRPPFRAASHVDTLLQVIEQEVLPPRDLNPTIDREIELICLKCLQKPADLRYTSAGELAADLDAYLSGESLSTRPSGLGYFVSRLLRETHHAAVLENWGVLWMWHSLMIFLLCLATQIMAWQHVDMHGYYLALWSGGLLTWGSILWKLRRRAGPVLFVEQQIAHAWAAGILASISMFMIEVVAGLESLKLSPAIAVAAGMVMVFKAGILSGRFYIFAAMNFFVAGLMAAVPNYAHLMFGVVSAVSFFVPGLKYYRQRRDVLRREHPVGTSNPPRLRDG